MFYSDKIIDIKLKIMREVGIPCADFYLSVADRSLDDDKTLVESRLLPGSNLHLRRDLDEVLEAVLTMIYQILKCTKKMRT